MKRSYVTQDWKKSKKTFLWDPPRKPEICIVKSGPVFSEGLIAHFDGLVNVTEVFYKHRNSCWNCVIAYMWTRQMIENPTFFSKPVNLSNTDGMPFSKNSKESIKWAAVKNKAINSYTKDIQQLIISNFCFKAVVFSVTTSISSVS